MDDGAVMIALLPWAWDWSPAAWEAIATCLTFVVAAIAAGFAFQQVGEARKTREEQAQPFVIVDFEPGQASASLMDLVIRNTGSTLATDVQFAFDPPLGTVTGQKAPDYRIESSALLVRGIPTLPPGREYRMFFDSMIDRRSSALPRAYVCWVTFKDSRQRTHRLEYRLDLDMYFGVLHTETYGAHDAAKALREINKTIKNWTNHQGLTVWTHDGDAYDQRRDDEWQERLREQELDDAGE